MKLFIGAVKNLLADDNGPTAVEYAVMLALIIVVCIVAIQTIGQSANDTFDNVGQTIDSTTSSP